mmetsp:Transcript_133905/g.231594  ORF Transcript_133905/g.231594 Transcript_133905/m.231594 type:complete len:639 (-) Transcript_133905:62-1978(-)
MSYPSAPLKIFKLHLWLLLQVHMLTVEAAAPKSFSCPWQSRHTAIWDELPNGAGYRKREGEDLVANLPTGCNLVADSERREVFVGSFLQLNSATVNQHRNGRESERLPLVPYPQKVELLEDTNGAFVLSGATVVKAGPGIPENDMSLVSLRQRIDEVLPRSVGSLTTGNPSSLISLDLEPKDGADPESYKLSISSGHAALTAPALQGLFYGVQTLRQLIPYSLEQQGQPSGLRIRSNSFVQINVSNTAAARQLPALVIEDAPALKWRGLQLDVSRHFFTADQVIKLLSTMAAFKMNKFHWHLTDDQGWRLPVKDYPELTRKGAGPRYEGHRKIESGPNFEGFYTEEDINRVVKHAADHHIEVIPEVDVPGHAAAAIAAYPELGNADAAPPAGPTHSWGVHAWTLAPTAKATSFLQSVFGTVARLFPSKYIHVGGDEAPQDQWRSASRRTKQGWEPEAVHERNVQSFFNRKVGTILAELGKSMAGWDEVQAMPGLRNDTTIFAWRSENELRKAVKDGRPVVNADSGHLYLDHYQGPESREPKAIGGFTSLAQVYAYEPVPAFVKEKDRHLILGAQGQLWSEYFPDWERVEYMAFPRAMALAERLWTSKNEIRGFQDFQKRLHPRLTDLQHWNVSFRSMD